MKFIIMILFNDNIIIINVFLSLITSDYKEITSTYDRWRMYQINKPKLKIILYFNIGILEINLFFVKNSSKSAWINALVLRKTQEKSKTLRGTNRIYFFAFLYNFF